MNLTWFLSLYLFAVPKPDFLYETASLQHGGDISFQVENKFYFILLSILTFILINIEDIHIGEKPYSHSYWCRFLLVF